jgi:hypothetical protein
LSLELRQGAGTARLLGEPVIGGRGRHSCSGTGTPDPRVGDGDLFRLWQGGPLETCCSRD